MQHINKFSNTYTSNYNPPGFLEPCSEMQELGYSINWSRKSINNRVQYFLGDDFPGRYLTQREAEVLCLIPDYTYKGIGLQLGLSHRTVELYTANIMKKLNCSSKAELKKLVLEGNTLEPLRALLAN